MNRGCVVRESSTAKGRKMTIQKYDATIKYARRGHHPLRKEVTLRYSIKIGG